MKHLKSFKIFESYDDLEFINESKLYIMPTFFKALSSAPVEFIGIVNDLRDLYGEETGQDITFVDIDDDTLSYSTMRNIEKEFPKLYNQALKWIPSTEISSWSHDISESPTRGNIKIGKFINKVINTPKKYPESLIDKFVTYLRSKSKNKETYDIKLVKGDEIAKYYNSSNYAEMRGTLGSSCMTDKKDGRPDVTVNTPHGTSTTYGFKGANTNLFDLYTKNPEVCSLLIMTNGEGKLVARALVWNVKVNFARDFKENNVDLNEIQFVDRVYTTEDWMVHKMCNWAEERGMATKYYHSYHDKDEIVYKGIKHYAEMEVSIKKIHYAGFPFLDTFSYYDVKNGKLYNYKESKFSGFGLQSTQGNYGTTTGTMPRVRNYIRKFR